MSVTVKNSRRHDALGEYKLYCGRHGKLRNEIPILKPIFNPFSFSKNLSIVTHFNLISHCATIESNVMHQFESYLDPLTS